MSNVDPVIELCRVERTEISGGILQFTCFSSRMVTPVGFVWGILAWHGSNESRYDIVHIHTLPMFQRHGVATKMLNEILKECRVLLTWSVTESGNKFTKAFGFKHDVERAQWYYIRGK